MGFFKQLKQGLDAARNPPDPAAIEASLRSLTREQRAAYDANMAEVEAAMAESQASWEQAAAINDEARILGGPAGDHLYGRSARELGSPLQLQARIAEVGVWQAQKEVRAKRKGELKGVVRDTFNRDVVPQEEDPQERARIAAEQRAARDAARAPFRAPDRTEIAISRVSTCGDTQLADVLDHLGASGLAARPDRVFGLYRVPDRISQALTPHSEAGRVVEWDVVHAPVDGGPCAPPRVTSFVGEERWVKRAVGAPSLLDEDLGLAYLRAAGLGPEHCLGLARMLELRTPKGGGEDAELHTFVRGLVVVHPDVGPGPFERLRAAAPMGLPAEPEGVHCEVLNWDVVARAVRPKIRHPPPVPSPFPYLPSTPQELLRSYLEVVGLRPEDSYSVQATASSTVPLVQGGLFTTNLGPQQPCADGKPRMRTHGCQHVVVVYRDRPEYAVGRTRWAAYERDVLQAALRKGTAKREPIQVLPELETLISFKPLLVAARVAERIDALSDWGSETVVPYRFCWPPEEAP